METLICNSPSFHRLTLSQYRKGFGLSATPSYAIHLVFKD